MPGGDPPRAGAQRRRRVRVPPRADARGGVRGHPARRALPLPRRDRAGAEGERRIWRRGTAVAAAELAQHWKAAHELDEALAASVEAGRAAARIGAFPEAQRHFEYALDVWDRVEGPEARAEMDRST